MDQRLRLNDAKEVLATIRESLSKAYKESQHWDSRGRIDDEEEIVNYFIERAFIQTTIFLEAAGLNQTLAELNRLKREASQDYSEIATYSDGIYLIWASKLEAYLDALEATFVSAKPKTVVKELLDIVKATQYSITDRNCFADPPKNETDVHVRIEAVLRCVFPDLRNRPPIAKPIKNFQPDTGLPSLRTLIEYKYVESIQDVRRVVDEVLADTRGYPSIEWDRFIYVIYETVRLKPETEWINMLRDNGVPENTTVIVISGERRIASTRRTSKRERPR